MALMPRITVAASAVLALMLCPSKPIRGISASSSMAVFPAFCVSSSLSRCFSFFARVSAYTPPVTVASVSSRIVPIDGAYFWWFGLFCFFTWAMYSFRKPSRSVSSGIRLATRAALWLVCLSRLTTSGAVFTFCSLAGRRLSCAASCALAASCSACRRCASFSSNHLAMCFSLSDLARVARAVSSVDLPHVHRRRRAARRLLAAGASRPAPRTS